MTLEKANIAEFISSVYDLNVRMLGQEFLFMIPRHFFEVVVDFKYSVMFLNYRDIGRIWERV
jgi:hypothetical protein